MYTWEQLEKESDRHHLLHLFLVCVCVCQWYSRFAKNIKSTKIGFSLLLLIHWLNTHLFTFVWIFLGRSHMNGHSNEPNLFAEKQRSSKRIERRISHFMSTCVCTNHQIDHCFFLANVSFFMPYSLFVFDHTYTMPLWAISCRSFCFPDVCA